MYIGTSVGAAAHGGPSPDKMGTALGRRGYNRTHIIDSRAAEGGGPYYQY